ncbi:hypothetical protein CRM86_20570 [Pseudomonas putida]|nr:hypothetical protein CRM86_20570 [Pseudomonas putida]
MGMCMDTEHVYLTRQFKAYERTMPLDVASWQSGAGLAGVLKATFQRYPDIELELKALILRKVKGESKKRHGSFFGA